MKQADLDRAVAAATGESVSTIKQLGFVLAEPDDDFNADSEMYGPHVIDWDELDSQRNSWGVWRPHDAPAVV